MKRGVFLVTGFLIGFLFWQILPARAEGNILINEISAKSSPEWVELYIETPLTSDASVELKDFVGKSTSTIVVASTSGFVVMYWSGSVLNNTTDTVYLFVDGSNVDAVEYVNTSNNDLHWARRPDGGAWATTTVFTMGETNQFEIADDSVEPEDEDSDELPVYDEGAVAEASPDYSFWQNIKLNEIMAAPGEDENEKVELYNLSTSTYELVGGHVCDNHATSTYCKTAGGVIAGNGYLVIDLGTRSLLNNDADSVILKNPAGEIIDEKIYSGDSAPKSGESLARAIDGVGDWQITTQITLGAANIIVSRPTPPPSSSSSGGGGSSYSSSPVVSVTITAPPVTTTILINEIYPDPPGADNSGEFIEIFNFGASAVDLGGWKIKDKEKSYNLSSNISAGGYLVLKREDTGIALNNTTAESVILVDAWGREADKISYERARTGESYNRTPNGWLWSAAITPGAKNVIEEEDAVGLIWKIIAPESGEVGEKLKFSALGSVDPRGGQLNFVWKFASGTIFSGAAVEYSFATSGIFEIELSATSTAGSSGSKKLSVKIGTGLSVQNANVGITEIFPNPDGADDGEYIEIYNFGSSTVNLAGWNLRADAKQYEIPVKTNIAPNSTLVFYRAATKIALNNSGGKVSLLTPAGEAVDLVKYDKAVSGKSYSYQNNIWQWVVPSPGTPPTPFFQEGDTRLSPPARGGEAEGVGATVRLASVKSTNSTGWFTLTTISDARAKPKDAKVKVRGVVSVLPGVFGSQYFYISSPEGGGIQIYQNKKYFPKLTIGNEVEVSGAVSEASGQKRVRAASVVDIKILGAGKEITSTDIGLDELDESLLGGLLKITGDITEIKSNYMYVDNGAGEVGVFFKTGAKIDKMQFKEGDKVEVVGVLENVKGDFQIWPRSSEDIKVVGIAPEVAGVKIAAPGRMRMYVLAIISAIGALGLGFLLRERGKVLEWLKKIFKV